MKNYSGQTRWRYYCSYSCPACHIKHSFFRLAVDDCNDYLPDNFFLLSYIKKAFREHFEFKELSCYIVNEQDLFFFVVRNMRWILGYVSARLAFVSGNCF